MATARSAPDASPRREEQARDPVQDKLAERDGFDKQSALHRHDDGRVKQEAAVDEKKVAAKEDAPAPVLEKRATSRKADTYRYDDNDEAKNGALGGAAKNLDAVGPAGASASGTFGGDARKPPPKPAEEKPMSAPMSAPIASAKAPAKSVAANAASPAPPASGESAGVMSQADLNNARTDLLLKRESKGKDKKRGDADRAHREEASTLALATGMRELGSKNYQSALDELQRAESIDTDQALGAQPQMGEMKALLGLHRGADAGRIARRLSSRDGKVPGIGDAWITGTTVAQQIGDTTLERDLWTRLLEVPAHRAEAQAALAKLSSPSHYPSPAPNRAYKSKASAATTDFSDEAAAAPAAAAPPADAESSKAK
jgi:hypothetical protein